MTTRNKWGEPKRAKVFPPGVGGHRGPKTDGKPVIENLDAGATLTGTKSGKRQSPTVFAIGTPVAHRPHSHQTPPPVIFFAFQGGIMVGAFCRNTVFSTSVLAAEAAIVFAGTVRRSFFVWSRAQGFGQEFRAVVQGPRGGPTDLCSGEHRWKKTCTIR